MVPNTAPLRGIFDVHPVALRARGELPDTFAAPSFCSGQGSVQASGTPAPSRWDGRGSQRTAPSPCVSRFIIGFIRPGTPPFGRQSALRQGPSPTRRGYPTRLHPPAPLAPPAKVGVRRRSEVHVSPCGYLPGGHDVAGTMTLTVRWLDH